MTRLAYLSSLAAAELAEARRNYTAAWRAVAMAKGALQ